MSITWSGLQSRKDDGSFELLKELCGVAKVKYIELHHKTASELPMNVYGFQSAHIRKDRAKGNARASYNVTYSINEDGKPCPGVLVTQFKPFGSLDISTSFVADTDLNRMRLARQMAHEGGCAYEVADQELKEVIGRMIVRPHKKPTKIELELENARQRIRDLEAQAKTDVPVDDTNDDSVDDAGSSGSKEEEKINKNSSRWKRSWNIWKGAEENKKVHQEWIDHKRSTEFYNLHIEPKVIEVYKKQP